MFVFKVSKWYKLLLIGIWILRISKAISVSFPISLLIVVIWYVLICKVCALDVYLRVIQQTKKCTSWFSEYESRSCKSKATLISNSPLKSNGRHILPKLYVHFHCLCLSHDIKVETLELSWELPAAYSMYIVLTRL